MDIIKRIDCQVVEFVNLMDPENYAFYLRLGFAFALAMCLLRYSISCGCRSTPVQVSLCILAVLIAAPLPLVRMNLPPRPKAWLFIASILATLILPLALPKWICSNAEIQRRLTKWIYVGVATIILVQLFRGGY